jgi:hypothetical protein
MALACAKSFTRSGKMSISSAALFSSKTGRKPVYLPAAALAIFAGLPRLEGNPHIIAGRKDGAPRADLKNHVEAQWLP